jgi:hypothetical protein
MQLFIPGGMHENQIKLINIEAEKLRFVTGKNISPA